MEHLTVLNWVAGFGVLVTTLLSAYVLYRSRTSTVLREERDAFRERAKRVDEDNAKLTAEGHAKDILIAELKGKTDLDSVKAQMLAIQQHMAQQFSESTITIVGMIQTISKDIMSGFSKHAEDDRAFQERVSSILERIESRL